MRGFEVRQATSMARRHTIPTALDRVIKGPRVAVTFSKITKQEWTTLETTLGAKIPTAARFLINGTTGLLAVGSPANHQTMTVAALANAARTWKVQTQQFRRTVWNAPPAHTPHALTQTIIQESLEEHFISDQARSYLGFLAGVLDAALASVTYVLQEVTTTQYAGIRQYELWLIWAALVRSALAKSSIEIKRTTKRRKEFSPKFVTFMLELQHHLPDNSQSRKSRASMLKGLADAEGLAENHGDLFLFGFLGEWGIVNASGTGPEQEKRNKYRRSMIIASRSFLSKKNKRRAGRTRKPEEP